MSVCRDREEEGDESGYGGEESACENGRFPGMLMGSASGVRVQGIKLGIMDTAFAVCSLLFSFPFCSSLCFPFFLRKKCFLIMCVDIKFAFQSRKSRGPSYSQKLQSPIPHPPLFSSPNPKTKHPQHTQFITIHNAMPLSPPYPPCT